jgi:hypothetical protein
LTQPDQIGPPGPVGLGSIPRSDPPLPLSLGRLLTHSRMSPSAHGAAVSPPCPRPPSPHPVSVVWGSLSPSHDLPHPPIRFDSCGPSRSFSPSEPYCGEGFGPDAAVLRRCLSASPTGQQRVLDVARRRWCRGAPCAATVASRRCCYYYCELTSLSL